MHARSEGSNRGGRNYKLQERAEPLALRGAWSPLAVAGACSIISGLTHDQSLRTGTDADLAVTVRHGDLPPLMVVA